MPLDANLLIIFLTGLTTGGLTCLAVQGGLLASVISPGEDKLKEELTEANKALPIVSFLTTKLIAHTILGFLLGLAGSTFTLSPYLRGWFQVAIGLYLAGIALSLLKVHPLFRYFIIQPPKFLSRLVRTQSKSKSLFAPALLGALTIFIPCATTQAMEVLALGTANPLYSAAIMFAFVLGTSPTFFILGFLFSKLGDHFQGWFNRAAATLLIFMAVLTFNGGIGLMGSIYTLQNFAEAFKLSLTGFPRVLGVMAQEKSGFQEVYLQVSRAGYSPRNITLKRGVPTRLFLTTDNTGGCSRAFTIPGLGIQKILPVTGTETVDFTPMKTGPLVFACSMGMFTGTFNVI